MTAPDQAVHQGDVRHICSLSGGKDSTAMAILLAKHLPNVELVFADTGRELPEVYNYVEQVGRVLGKPIVRLHGSQGRGFDEFLEGQHYYLPNPLARWCTNELKIRPFDRFVRGSECVVYVGLRADEGDRVGNFGLRQNVTYAYPLRDEGIVRADIKGIIEGAGLEMPSYYKWRSTGGCWCCFFQRKSDWAGLRMFHPDLFAVAVGDEIASASTSRSFFGWRGNGKPLTQLEAAWQPPLELDDEWEDGRPCLICAK